MKKLTTIISVMIMSIHPSVKKCGERAHKNSQNYLSSQFGGSNFNGPNKFKKTHF